MKALCLVLTYFIFQGLGQAQEDSFQKYEWEVIGFSVTRAFGPDLRYGVGIHSEPRINLSNRWSLGLRGDATLLEDTESRESFPFQYIASLSLVCDYYFTTEGDIRTFVGLGLGVYDDDRESIGFFPRIGCEFGLFRLSADYNYTFNKYVPEYFAMKLGINIGGRHRVK